MDADASRAVADDPIFGELLSVMNFESESSEQSAQAAMDSADLDALMLALGDEGAPPADVSEGIPPA